MPKKSRKPKNSAAPSREQLLAFIQERGGRVSKREIVRTFRLDAAGKAELNSLLRGLRGEGQIDRSRRHLHVAGRLPDIVVAEITGRDRDGELIAEPAEWDEAEHGEAPKIRLAFGRQPRHGPAPGIGDRALLRIREINEPGVRHEGRVIKLLEKAPVRILGIFRALPDGSGRLVPVDKKSLGREVSIARGATGGAADGDLVSTELLAQRAHGLPQARVRERLGSVKSERAVSLIAIHAHGIPNVFPPQALAEALLESLVKPGLSLVTSNPM